jgi:Ni,Fe-hydrogenase III large subunit
MNAESPIITGYFNRGDKNFILSEGSEYAVEVNDDIIGKIPVKPALDGVYGHPSEGDNVFSFNYGPSTGGLVETINMKIYTYGERILSVMARPDFKDRRIHVGGNSLRNGGLIMERYNGFHSFSYSTLFCRAVESIKGISLNTEDVRTRVILLETERIISHIFKSARLCEAASQNIASYWLLSLRERLLRLLGEVAGHRYLFGVNRIGGLNRHIDLDKLQKGVESIVNEFRTVVKGLYTSRIFIDRLENTCKTDSTHTRGPALRAAGSRFDYRNYDPYYRDIDVKLPSEKDADALARFLVFTAEVDSSFDIICNANPQASEDQQDESGTDVPIYSVETPSGDAQLMLKTEGDHIIDAYLRTPSMLNLEAFCSGIKGNVKTDLPFAFESFGIWISEIGGIQ